MAAIRDPEDAELVRRVVERDEVAFRQLFRRHTPAAVALAARLLGAPRADLAEDVVQEAWLRAASAIATFAWRSTFRTWLAGFVVNCARETMRREPRLAEPLDEERLFHLPAASTSIDLERALGALPNGYREVLVLHDLAGFTHGEIAQRLEIAIGTSKSQLARARRSLGAAWRGDSSAGETNHGGSRR